MCHFNRKKSCLFQFEYMLHEKLLQILVGKVDAHLLEAETIAKPTRCSFTTITYLRKTKDI